VARCQKPKGPNLIVRFLLGHGDMFSAPPMAFL
jgi:hypothetical protein